MGRMIQLNSFDLTETVWEDYNIEYFTRLLKNLNSDPSRKHKEQVYEKLVQNNLFLIRRLRDPGFYQFIGRIFFDDREFQRYAIQYIRHEIATCIIRGDLFFDPFVKMPEWDELRRPSRRR
jgi:hypothetical protein